MEQDLETKLQLNRGRVVTELLNSEGWEIVQDIIIQSISDIASLTSITTKNPQELLKEVGAKQLAATALTNWLAEINSIASQYEANKNTPINRDDYILNIEPKNDRT